EMLIRSVLRSASAASALKQCTADQSNFRSIATKATSKPPAPTKGKKPPSKATKIEQAQATIPETFLKDQAELRRRQLAEDEKNPNADVFPDGRPLFTSAASLSTLCKDDVNTYFRFSMDELKEVLPEGLPPGMVKEFEESWRSALLVRQHFIELRDNFRRAADPPSLLVHSKAPTFRKQIVLDGPVSCGKSITLAMLVYWARKEGWLVFYVPGGRSWTHGGFFYKNPHTGRWDTPVQAAAILRDFLKYNKPCLQGLKCSILDPVPLGEGAGVGPPRGGDEMEVARGTTLCDIVEAGIRNTHAAVGVVVRLREELSKVSSVPVLFAIDQYNNWFTFTEFEEPVTVRSCRPIHAKELSTVNAFRSMMHDNMMVGAFSHSTAVGKLRLELPDVPLDSRINLPRYSFDEAAAVSRYYLRQRLVKQESFSEENWKKIFFLSNGNGTEMRYLFPFMR
ncbi:hypothetical protein M569_12302, partial [Genlisea aurea]